MMSDTIRSFKELQHALRKTGKDTKLKVLMLGLPSEQDLAALKLVFDKHPLSLQMVGNREKIADRLKKINLKVNKEDIIHEPDVRQILLKAWQKGEAGEVDCIINGEMGWRAMEDGFLGLDSKDSGGKPIFLNHIGVYEISSLERLLFLGDMYGAAEPGVKEKAAITTNLGRLAHKVLGRAPKVALLAVVELVYPGMEATTDAAVVAKMGDRGQLGDMLVDGPLSLDVALEPQVAEAKKVKGDVAGRADVLIATKPELGLTLGRSFELNVCARCAEMILSDSGFYMLPYEPGKEEKLDTSLTLLRWLMYKT